MLTSQSGILSLPNTGQEQHSKTGLLRGLQKTQSGSDTLPSLQQAFSRQSRLQSKLSDGSAQLP
jgi:hypothetical protein